MATAALGRQQQSSAWGIRSSRTKVHGPAPSAAVDAVSVSVH